MTYSDVTKNVVTTTGFSTDEHVEPFQTATMTCMVLPHELVFVDCGIIPEIASKFRSDMEERFQKDTSHLLLTHVHWDHIFGMEAFEDVRIVASTVGITYLKKNLKGMFSKERREKTAKRRFSNRKEIAECIKNAKLFLPHIGVKEELRIGPKEEVIFKVIGGHSKDSACVYAPEERVLCTGDNLLTYYAQLPGNPRKTLEIFSRKGVHHCGSHLLRGITFCFEDTEGSTPSFKRRSQSPQSPTLFWKGSTTLDRGRQILH